MSINKESNFDAGLIQVVNKTVKLLGLGGLVSGISYILLPSFLFGTIHFLTFFCAIPIILGFLISVKNYKVKHLFWEFLNVMFLLLNGGIIILAIVILIAVLFMEFRMFLVTISYFLAGGNLYLSSLKVTQGYSLYKTPSSFERIETWRSEILDDEAFLNSN